MEAPSAGHAHAATAALDAGTLPCACDESVIRFCTYYTYFMLVFMLV
jgi:hypothetical protein